MSTKIDTANPKPELSRTVMVDKLGLQPFVLDITPSAGELKALADRLKIDSLDALQAQISLQLLPNDDVRLDATFSAHITQTCGVTLDPVENSISSSFSMIYSDEAEEFFGPEDEDSADLDEDFEPLEPIEDGKIDVGEAVVEHLALEIDPFPRVKGATFDGYSTGNGDAEEAVLEKKNPFAVLSKLKETPKS